MRLNTINYIPLIQAGLSDTTSFLYSVVFYVVLYGVPRQRVLDDDDGKITSGIVLYLAGVSASHCRDKVPFVYDLFEGNFQNTAK